MPLRCVDEQGATIDASTCSEAEWKALRARARAERHLRMPCCPAQAVLKTSRLGTRFFAHKAKGTCTWKPEGDVHIHLKALTLNAAREAGWGAESESSGSTPDGERWTADVLAWRDDEKIAVEIQWSGQTNEETLRRQERYRRSGIMGVWLLRQPGFPISEDLPAACIGGTVEEGLKVLIPKRADASARHREEKRHWAQTLAAERFMTAVFEGRFRFGIPHATKVRIDITTELAPCENGTKYLANLCKWQRPVPATMKEAKFMMSAGPHRIETTHQMAGTLSGLDEQIRNRICPRNVYTGHGKNRRQMFIWCSKCGRTVALVRDKHEIHKVFNYDLGTDVERMFVEWVGTKETLDGLERWAVWETRAAT